MNQPELDFTRARVHTGDHSSSHRAAANLYKSGKLCRQQRDVLDIVATFEGCGARELARASVNWIDMWTSLSTNKVERLYQIRRRLSDLSNPRVICPVRVRQERVAGQREVSWFLA